MEAFADVVRPGKAHYIGVSEWTADQLRAGHALAHELRIPLVSNQPQYSMLWRVIEAEVVPTSEELGISQIVWSPIAQGVLTGKYLPGQAPPEGSRATDDKGGAGHISAHGRRGAQRRAEARRSPTRPASRWRSSPSPGCCRTRTSRPPSSAPPAPSSCGQRQSIRSQARRRPAEAIDDALGEVAESDPGKTAEGTPKGRVV